MRVQKFKRGQVWWCNFGSSFDGSVPGKTRPIIIISNDLANKYSNCLLGIPLTSQSKKDMPTHTTFDINGILNTALAENLMSININKLSEYICTLDDELLLKIEDNLKVALGLVPLVKNEVNFDIITDQLATSMELEVDEPVTKIEVEKPIVERVSTIRASRLKYKEEERKLEFVKNYETHSLDWMKTYYDESSDAAVMSKYYRFKRLLKKVGE